MKSSHCELNPDNSSSSRSDAALRLSLPDNTLVMVLLAKISRLESELRHKESALAHSLNEQMKLQDSLNLCIQTLQKSQRQIRQVNSELILDYQQMVDRIAALEQENTQLEDSNNAWSGRAIQLEFDVLTRQAEINNMKVDHDLSRTIVTLQEMELLAIKKKENANNPSS